MIVKPVCFDAGFIHDRSSKSEVSRRYPDAAGATHRFLGIINYRIKISMQENLEERGVEMASVEELFLGIQESYAEAQARAMEENKSFAKTEFFRFDKLGVYRLRILPIAPNKEDVVERKGYEYPVRQLLMELERPNNGGKQANLYVTVPRATDAGYTLDLIDTYRHLAVNMAKEAGDEKLAEKIGGGSFGGGLRFNYGHAMYIIDLKERTKGIQLCTLSHAQFKELDERKFKLWEKKIAKNPNHPCPISSVYNAYPVEIEKRKNGGKTEYYISIDNESDNEILSKEELTLLMNSPRIPSIIYRYSRYHFEATLEYLKQCDAKYMLRVMDTPEMAEAIETFKGEIPKEDTSSFSFDKRSKDAKDNAQSNALTLDQLFDSYEQITAQGLGDKTEQGQDLRALIRAFIEQEKLPVRVTRSTTNGELLDMIEDAVHGLASADGEPAGEIADKDSDSSEPETTQPDRRRR